MFSHAMGIIAAALRTLSSSSWNPSDKGANITLSNSDRTASKATSGWTSVRGTRTRSAGNRYFEVTAGAAGVEMMIGVADAGAVLTTYFGNALNPSRQSAAHWGNATAGNLFINITSSSGQTVAGYASTDVLGVAVDFSAKTIKWYKNGTLLHTHTEGGTLNSLMPGASLQNTSSLTFNGAGPFGFQPGGTIPWDQ